MVHIQRIYPMTLAMAMCNVNSGVSRVGLKGGFQMSQI